MPAMTDPSDALASFQEVLPLGILPLQPGALDPTLFVMSDEPSPDVFRLTYVRLEGKLVTAMAIFVRDGFIEGRPCFALGYAVPIALRGQGRAKEIVQAALAEMAHGFGRAKMLPFFVEAIVGVDNAASQAVALSTVSANFEEITDAFSNLPARRYLRTIS